MLGVITFASIEAPTPDETWPLAPSMRTEPEWFKMGQRKSALCRLVEPDRPDSIFCALFSATPMVEFSLENVPPEFMKLYKLDGLSADSSPYAIPVSAYSLYGTSNAHRLRLHYSTCLTIACRMNSVVWCGTKIPAPFLSWRTGTPRSAPCSGGSEGGL